MVSFHTIPCILLKEVIQVYRIDGEGGGKLALQGVWCELNQNTAISSPGLKEVAHVVLAFLAVTFCLLEVDTAYTNRPLSFCSVPLTR